MTQLSHLAKRRHQKMRSVSPVNVDRPLDHVEVIFVESRHALEQAWDRGCPRSAEVRTPSPALLANPDLNAIPLDRDNSGEVLRSLGQSCHDLACSFHSELRRDPDLNELALTIVRAIPAFQRILYKAMGLRAEDFRRPIAIIDHRFLSAVNESRFNGPLARLLGSNPECVRLTVETEDVAAVWTTRAGLSARLRFEPLVSIAYRAMLGFFKRLPLSLRGTVLIYSENSLVKETAASLALRGYVLRPLSGLPSQRAKLPPQQEQRLRTVLSTRLRPWLAPLVTAQVIETLVEWFAEMAIERSERYLGALAEWPRQFERKGGPRPTAVLCGDIPRPETEALYRCCRSLQIPLYCFQHGTAIELSDASRHAEYMDEICAADVFFSFNDVVRERLARNPFAVGRSISVGLPRDLCIVSNSRLGIRSAPPVYYVSCQLFMGNWQYPASIGLSDRENAEFEKSLVSGVLANLPHRILFKPYPSIRYLDANPVVGLAKTCRNIEVYEGWLDLRYLINGARVLIASHGGSTVSWCLLSGKPLVFIDCLHQVRLRPEVRKAFEAAVFVFDAGTANFHASMLQFLSQPIEHIEDMWRGKAEARGILIKQWFGETSGRAGRRAADWITGAVRA